MKSILKNKLTGMYFDGLGFETTQLSNAKVIDGPLAHAAVCSIWGANVEIIEQAERFRFTYHHESGGMTFTVNATSQIAARSKLASAICSTAAANNYWALANTEEIK